MLTKFFHGIIYGLWKACKTLSIIKEKHFFLPPGRLAKVWMKNRWPLKTVSDMVNIPTVRIHLSTRLFVSSYSFFCLQGSSLSLTVILPLYFLSFCYFLRLFFFASSASPLVLLPSLFFSVFLPYIHMCSMTPFDLHQTFNLDWWPGLTWAHEDLSSFLLFCLFLSKVSLFLTPSLTTVLFAL